MNIRHGNRNISSGIVTPETKITFRSRSSRIIWLIQISSEMWDYASPYETQQQNCRSKTAYDAASCDIYFDKLTSFLHKLFKKWNELEVCERYLMAFVLKNLEGLLISFMRLLNINGLFLVSYCTLGDTFLNYCIFQSYLY